MTNKVVRTGLTADLDNFFRRCAGAGIAQIFHDGGIEKETLLKNDSDGLAQVGQINRADVVVADADCALIGFDQQRKHTDQGGFTCTGGAGDGADIPVGNRERDVFDDLKARPVGLKGKGDMVEGDIFAHAGFGPAGPAGRCRLFLQQIQRPFDTGTGPGQFAAAAHQFDDRGIQKANIPEEGDKFPGQHGFIRRPADHLPGAEADQRQHAGPDQDIRPDFLKNHITQAFRLTVAGRSDGLLKRPALPLFAAEPLDHFDTDQVFNNISGCKISGLPRAAAGMFDAFPEIAVGEHMQRQHKRRRQGQLPVEHINHHHNPGKEQCRLNELRHDALNKLLDFERVIHHLAGQLAGALSAGENQAFLLNALEELRAQAEANLFTDLNGRTLALIEEKIAQQKQQRQSAQNHPEQRPVAFRKNTTEHRADQDRRQHVHCGQQNQRQDGTGHRQP